MSNEKMPLPASWSDALGVATVGEVRARLLRFQNDLKILPRATDPSYLSEVYHGATGMPSAATLQQYIATTTQHLHDILSNMS